MYPIWGPMGGTPGFTTTPLVLDENVQVRDKTLDWPEAVKFMHMRLLQMEARILRAKLHQKLTSIISVALY